jgi:hypothetical protein
MSAYVRKEDIEHYCQPVWALWGRLRVGKSFLHVCSIGLCSHVCGLRRSRAGGGAVHSIRSRLGDSATLRDGRIFFL